MRKKIVYGIPSARIDEIRWLLDCIIDENGRNTIVRDISFEQNTYNDDTPLSTNLEITVETP